MRKNLLFIFIILTEMAIGQSISGKIYDAESGAPLIGATIKVMKSDFGTTSDMLGDYKIEILEQGVYTLEIRYVGYRTKQIQELSINRGTGVFLDFALSPNFNGLDSLIVTEKQLLVQPGKLTITQEQLNRFAATYYDPARMMTTSSDILVANDQNNQISVRGISPAYNVWRLEGAEILNPNHLANAGTFSDQATSNGGGVNILSAQMMSRSSFNYGAFEPALGNSVGGIFNMNIKNGGTESNHVVQASLIGLDFSSEGKVGQNEKLTYAANYRYSFTGLLSNFGVDFGGEKIGFQDLSFSLKYHINPKTDVKLFALGGLNFNRFTGLPFEESEDEKDRSNIHFEGEMGAIGATINYQSSGFKVFSTLLFSASQNIRNQEFNNVRDEIDFVSGSNDSRKLLSHRFEINKNLNGNQFQLGVLNNLYVYDFITSSTPWPGTNFSTAVNDKTEILIQPYVNYSAQLSSQLFFKMGTNFSWNVDGETQIDPRVQLTKFFSESQSLTFAAGRYSQLLGPENYYYYNPFQRDIRTRELGIDYDFITSWRFTLSHSFQSPILNTNIELFHYYFNNPVLDDVDPEILINGASTSGISLQLDKSFDNQFYARMGVTYFRSLIDPDIVTQQYDNRYSSSLALGKEWKLKSGKKTSLNFRGIYQGGLHYPGLGFSGIADYGSYQTEDYLRFDLRWQLVNYHEKWTSTLSIDIQNVMNRENEAYLYFDTFANDVQTQYQLGMIPILTYRVAF